MQLEQRALAMYRPGLGVELRATGDPVIRGYAAVFGAIADFGWMQESISPGAFSRALREQQDVRALIEHDPALILGRTKSGTLKLSEDETGLFSEIVPPDTQVGRDALASLKRGDLDQMSFAFVVRREMWIEEKGKVPLRQIEDVDLYDVSVVAFPAYEATSVSVRSKLEEFCRPKVDEILRRQRSAGAELAEVYERGARHLY